MRSSAWIIGGGVVALAALCAPREAGAWFDPITNPDADGSWLGGARVGDYPPASCWSSSTADVRMLGPIFPGDVAVHVAGGATTGTRRVHIGSFGSPSWSCDLTVTNDYLCATPVGDYPWGGFPGDFVDYTWANPSPAGTGPSVAIAPNPTASEVYDPFLGQPVDPATAAISVMGLHPGAEVTVSYLGNTYRGYALDKSYADVVVPPGIPGGTTLTITQDVGNVTRTVTATSVSGARGPYGIRAPWGFEKGAYAVPVAGFTPGSVITVKDASTNAVIGSAAFGEPVGVVPVCAAPSSVIIEATRNGQTVSTTVAAREYRDDVGSTIATTGEWGSSACDANPSLPECFESVPVPPEAGQNVGERMYYRVVAPASGLYRGLVLLVHGNNHGGSIPDEELCDYPGGYEYDSDAGYDVDEIGYDNRDDSFAAWEGLQSRLARSGFKTVSIDVHGVGLGKSSWVLGALERIQPSGGLPVALVGLSVGAMAVENLCAAADSAVVEEHEIRACVMLGSARQNTVIANYPDVDVSALFISGEHEWFGVDGEGYRMAAEWPFDVGHVTIPGGVHSYFNECWLPEYHGPSPATDLPDIYRDGQLLIVEELVQRYLTMVFDANDGVSRSGDLARGHVSLFSNLMNGIYLNSYRSVSFWRAGTRLVVDDFEDSPLNVNQFLESNSVTGAVSASETMVVESGERSSPENTMARVEWSGAGGVRFGLNAVVGAPLESHILTFTLLSPLDEEGDDFLTDQVAVVLRDGDGDEAQLGLASFGGPRPSFSTPQYWGRESFPHSISIPLSSFRAVNSSLDLDDLVRLAFRFRAGSVGLLYFDDISFVTP